MEKEDDGSIRYKLEPYLNQRTRFRGTFLKLGRKMGYKGPEVTVLIINISLVEDPLQNIVTGHLWFRYTKGFEQLILQSGDVVEFTARVTYYKKGYSETDEENPKRLDYHLSHPRNIVKRGRVEGDHSSYDLANQILLQQVSEWWDAKRTAIQQRAELITSAKEHSGPYPIKQKSREKWRDCKITDF